MKFKKSIGVLAFSLAMLIPFIGNEAKASDLTISTQENKIDEKDTTKLDNYDLSKKDELDSYKFNQSEPDFIDQFDKEIEIRLELARQIKILEKSSYDNKDLIKESYLILNGSDLDKVKKQTQSLRLLLEEFNKQNPKEEINLTEDEEKSLEDKLKDLVNNGILLGINDKDKESLDVLTEAILNSRSYYEAGDNLSKKYDEIINLAREDDDYEKSFNLLDSFNKDSDKASFKIPQDTMTSDVENKSYTASNSTEVEENLEVYESTIENTSQTSGSETSESEKSAFLKNDKTSSKYNDLTDSQKRELDAIDTNKDGKISKEELDKSANYTSNLSQDSWIYPFTEESLEKVNSENSNADNQSENASDTTSTNNSTKALPQTVTIDEGKTKSPELKSEDQKADQNEDDNNKESTEDANFNESKANQSVVKENTSAASIVKTGITGTKFVIIALVIALGAYYFMYKNKDKDK